MAIACSIPLAASVTLAALLRTISAKGWWHRPYGNDAASVEITEGFPESSVGKESTCNAEYPSSVPGLGRSPREGIGYPLQYSWASLVAQLVKNLSAMWETWI